MLHRPATIKDAYGYFVFHEEAINPRVGIAVLIVVLSMLLIIMQR